MRLINPIILVFSVAILSCSRMSEDELFQAAQASYDQENFKQAAEQYEELVDRFPQGKHAEESLFLVANMYGEKMENYRLTIATHRKSRALYPQGEKAAASLFLIGFIYNNQLHDLDSARMAYLQFLSEYPQDAMAPSAKFELENLGKNPEELFKSRVAEKEEPAKSKGSKPVKKKK